jgi:signal transduction histidine kinase
MRRRLLTGYLIFTLVVLVALEVPLAIVLARRDHDQFVQSLREQATSFSVLAEEHLEDPVPADLRALANRFLIGANGALLVLDRSGGLLVATGTPPVATAHQPVTTTALDQARKDGSTSYAARVRDDGPKMYVVLAIIGTGADTRGFVAAVRPTSELDAKRTDSWLILVGLGLSILALAVVAALVLSRSLSRPLRDVALTAGQLGRGDLRARAPNDRGPADIRGLARTLNEMAARLEQLVGAHRAFVADASHQLRTPLTALRIRLDTLEASVPVDARPDFDRVVAETSRLARLVDGLLALARAEGLQPDRQRVDAVEVARDRVDNWAALADEREVDLRFAERGALVAWLVPGHLEQILDNLIANAIDAAAGTIEVAVVSAGDEVVVTVTDDGPGLSDEERPQAFDRFWRGRVTDSLGGSGLGLAIVQQLVRANRGQVALLPHAPHGIVAEVRLEQAG